MKKLRLLHVMAVLLMWTLPLRAETSKLFPQEGLESRVEFWKKVFTQYGADDVIIHDTDHVNLIYDVASPQELSTRVDVVRRALAEIRDNIDQPQSWSTAATEIASRVEEEGLRLDSDLAGELLAGIHTQRGIKERFRGGVIRSGRYVDHFKGVFAKHGLPTELALLPLVESSFENARSRVGAAGMWQFMRSTGRLYLTVNRRVDERLNPIKSTDAAARLLRDNFRALGTWPLALTAYNHGRAGMQRAQKRHGSDLDVIIRDYDGPYFGYASSNFYAEFLAAVDVHANYRDYFGDIALDSPISVENPSPVVKTASASSTKGATLKAGKGTPDRYKVRSGDTLSEIADRFGKSLRELMQINQLKRPMIYAGQILMIP